MGTEVIILVVSAFFGAFAVIYLHAAVHKSSFKDSREKLFGLLDEMARVLPQEYQKLAKKSLGAFGGFTVLMGLALMFNFVGKFLAPEISGWFHYFGDYGAQLWCENKDALFDVEDNLRKELGYRSPEEWKEFQDSLQRPYVRIVRTLIPFSILALLAGILDLISINRRRGLIVIGTSLFLFLSLNAGWAYLQGNYVRNLDAYLDAPIEELIAEQEEG